MLAVAIIALVVATLFGLSVIGHLVQLVTHVKALADATHLSVIVSQQNAETSRRMAAVVERPPAPVTVAPSSPVTSVREPATLVHNPKKTPH